MHVARFHSMHWRAALSPSHRRSPACMRLLHPLRAEAMRLPACPSHACCTVRPRVCLPAAPAHEQHPVAPLSRAGTLGHAHLSLAPGTAASERQCSPRRQAPDRRRRVRAGGPHRATSACCPRRSSSCGTPSRRCRKPGAAWPQKAWPFITCMPSLRRSACQPWQLWCRCWGVGSCGNELRRAGWRSARAPLPCLTRR